MSQSSGPGGVRRTAGAPPTRNAAPRGGKRRRRFPWKGLGLTFLALILLGIGLMGLAYSMVDIPKPNELANAQASVVYYADGKTELDRLSEVNRESVTIDKIKDKTRQAVISAEDRDFYDNAGISITGLGRAVWGALRGQDAGGGSTITQQYVKNYFLTSDQTLTRKGKEIIIAVKIDRELSKDQILENYLNTIYYGRNAYGIQTASKAYFGKDVSALNVSESAFLAAVINQPSALDPALGASAQKRATERWNYVLDGMVTKGWLTPAERAALTFPKVIAYTPKTTVGGTAGYLVDVVKDELRERGIKDEDVARGGLRITTTIDPKVQESLVASVRDNTPSSGAAAGVRVGAVSIVPGDGAIVALYGGRDFTTQQFNDATQGHIPAGSTMKTFATLASLQQGRSTKKTYSSDTPYRPQGTTDRIENYDGVSRGPISVPTMLALSVNTAFVRLNEEVGPENTMKAAIAAGIPPKDGDSPADTPGLEPNVANVLGSASVRPIDMANAYATVAGEGMRARPYIVRSVKTADGQSVYEGGKELTKAFEKDVAADTTDALRSVTRVGGTGSGASAVGRPVAGKTGTATNDKGNTVSAWFAAYTPQISTAVGMYLPDKNGTPQSMDRYGSLESGAAPVEIWAQFTRAYLQGQPVKDFPPRAGIGDDKVYTPPPPPSTTRPSPTTNSPSSTKPSPTPTPTTTSPQAPSLPGPPGAPGPPTTAPPATGAGGVRTGPALPPQPAAAR